MIELKINELYEQAHRIYEVPYESSVVDPTVVSFHKQKVWDRYLFARLIVRECFESIEKTIETNCDTDGEKIGCEFAITDLKEHFGIE